MLKRLPILLLITLSHSSFAGVPWAALVEALDAASELPEGRVSLRCTELETLKEDSQGVAVSCGDGEGWEEIKIPRAIYTTLKERTFLQGEKFFCGTLMKDAETYILKDIFSFLSCEEYEDRGERHDACVIN